MNALPTTSTITVTVNGARRTLDVDHRTSLLDLLREQLGLTGSKKGCDHGQCGACTVLIDGRRANACLALAVAHGGAEITTVEGLADGSKATRTVEDGRTAPAAGRVPRLRRLPVRLLHPGPALLGGRDARRARPVRRHRGSHGRPAADPGGDPRADERQPVPLRRLREHRPGDRRGGNGGDRRDEAFSYTRAESPADAVARFRPGAMYLGGGTNLVDLMRLGVAGPVTWSTSATCRSTRCGSRTAAGC